MKKLFVILTALMAVAIFATSSFAINKVQMTLTSPTIYKVGCEKIGSTTYSFDGGSDIAVGDWWYMDLPNNVSLCKSYDYIIAGIGTTGPNVTINAATDPYENVVFNGGELFNANGGGVGPVAPTDGPLTAGGSTPALTVTGNMAFLVKGTNGSRRVTIYALTSTGTGGAENLVSGADSTIQFKLFDGKSWSKNDVAVALGTRILLDIDGDGTYGELAYNAAGQDEVIDKDSTVDADTLGGVPYVENTLCANAASYASDILFTSYASKLDKFTFSGDSQIAHTASAGAIALVACAKKELDGTIEIDSSQAAAACWFDYEDGGGNYCDAPENRFLIEASDGAFGDIGDKFTIDASITSPADGVYFSAAPTIVRYKDSDDECVDSGTATTAGFDRYEGSDMISKWAPTTCTVDEGERVDTVKQTAATAFALDGFDTIWVSFAPFAFGNTLVTGGEEVTVSIDLNRYPCGTIANFSRTIGSFVSSCATSSASTLFFPWLPGTAATGWWGGYVITNVGDTDGVAELTYSDSMGNQATMTTPTVVAGAQWVDTDVTDDDLTDSDDSNPYDSSLNYSVTAACGFTARGFAFTGNGTEGTGYLANGSISGEMF